MAEDSPPTGQSEEERRRRLWLRHALQTPPPRPLPGADRQKGR